MKSRKREHCRALDCDTEVGAARPFCGYHWAMLGAEQRAAVEQAHVLRLKGRPQWWRVAVASAISHIARHEHVAASGAARPTVQRVS